MVIRLLAIKPETAEGTTIHSNWNPVKFAISAYTSLRWKEIDACIERLLNNEVVEIPTVDYGIEDEETSAAKSALFLVRLLAKSGIEAEVVKR